MQKYDSTYSKGLGICRQISDIDKAKQVKKAADAWKDA
jgi:hypothetical protein